MNWQRKLGAPKPSETFQELFNRARVLEQQYQESAASRSGDKQDKLIRSSSQQKGNGGNPNSERNTFPSMYPFMSALATIVTK